jgi:hypothetical protein
LLPLGDFEQPVIGRALLPIAQDGVGANNTPESFRSFRVAGIEIGWFALAALRNAALRPSASSSGSAPSKS